MLITRDDRPPGVIRPPPDVQYPLPPYTAGMYTTWRRPERSVAWVSLRYWTVLLYYLGATRMIPQVPATQAKLNSHNKILSSTIATYFQSSETCKWNKMTTKFLDTANNCWACNWNIPPIWKLFLSPMWKFWCRMKEAKADYLKKDYLEDCGIMLKLQT